MPKIVLELEMEIADKCEECRFNSYDSLCILDKDMRETSGWRPFWCPLKAVIPSADITNQYLNYFDSNSNKVK